MCWLYFVPNLLVIKQLNTLYVGGKYVRVVCESVCEEISRSVQFKGVSRLELATGKSPEWHTCEACRGSWRVTTVGALQDKASSLTRQLAHDSNSWLIPIARLSCQNALFDWNLTFRNPHTHHYKYPYTFQREFWERNPREKQDWLIHNPHPLIL